MSITLDGHSLTVEKLVRIARDREPVGARAGGPGPHQGMSRHAGGEDGRARSCTAPTPASASSARSCSTDEQVQQFQRFLVYNHAAGIGDPAPHEVVRGAMAARVNVHAHGNSGIRPEITQTLVEMLNKGVTPVICEKGSVGACGDLAPMAQIALLLMGEGESFYQGERLTSREAHGARRHPDPRAGGARRPGHHQRLQRAHGDERPALWDADRWLRQAEIACAMSLEALLANLKPYNTQAARAARLRRRGAQRRRHPRLHRGQRPRHRQDQDQGAGRLLHALHAAGHRRRPRRPGLGREPGRDRAQRRRRQPDLRARGQADADRRQLPGHARHRCPWRWSARPSPWSACSASAA